MATRPLSALLDRFRRGVAVPAAVGDDLAMELAPVFASLDEFEQEAQAVQSASTREAESRLEHAREEAARISSTWREEAEAERARAAEERRRRSRDEARKVEAEGRAEADRIRREASARVADLVEEILACVARGAAEVRPCTPGVETPNAGGAGKSRGADYGEHGATGDAPGEHGLGDSVAHGEPEP